MKKNIGFIIRYSLLILVYALYLEIYKNTLLGWILALSVFICYGYLRHKLITKKPWYIRFISVLCLFAVLILTAYISKAPYKQVPASAMKNPTQTPIISIEQGNLVGILNEDESVAIYAGIPYAKPPVGDLRWKEPQQPEPWSGVRVCDTFAPMSMQKESNPIYSAGSRIVGYHDFPISLNDNYKEAMSEDSLYLNIWTPNNASSTEKLPVLVYIHGGSLNSGQSYFDAYRGETLASKGIVVVTITYRLGVFGYYANDELISESPNKTTGNYGLLDQIQALRWVNENIAAFGGDVNNITIAGESAGSSSVNALCVSPLAKGLFRRSIAESSSITPKVPYHTFRTMDKAKEKGNLIMEEFNCKNIDELRQIPAQELVYTQYSNNEMTVDGYAITEQPYLTYKKGNNNEESVLGGYNGDEAYVFLMFDKMPGLAEYADSLKPIAGDMSDELATIWPADSDNEAKEKYTELVGIAWFGYSHYTWSELMKAQNKPAYMYYFTKDNKALGDWHSGELPYFYGNIPKNAKTYDSSDIALSETIQQYILNFVRTGDPNGDGLPHWYTYSENSEQVMSFSDKVEMIDNKYLEVFHFFDRYMDNISN